MWEKKRLLIWGKTYPEFSAKYYETVCTGALDAVTGKLVRIYPITLRHQKEGFRLYDWIEADVERNTSDFRPESHKIKQETIKVVGHIETKDEWAERSNWVLRPGNVFKSVEALRETEAQDHTSFGLVKPKRVRRVYARRKKPDEQVEWERRRDTAFAQRDLFVDLEVTRAELNYVPVEYRIEFECDDAACEGHDCSIGDWGIYVLHRNQMGITQSPQTTIDKVLAKINECVDLTKKNAHLFLGNTKEHSQNFMVVGLYYPPVEQPKKVSPPPVQGTLF